MKKIVALVLAMVMVLGLATTAFAAKAGGDFTEASGNYDWNFTVYAEDPEDVKDETFATYTIEGVANYDKVDMWWTAATETNVEKGDKEDVEINGEDEFVKILNADMAKVVVVDGKTITYFGVAEDYNDNGWFAVGTKVTLPTMPVDNADVKCNTMYAVSAAQTTLYYADYTLWVADKTSPVVLNVGGAAVNVKAAKEAVDYYVVDHEYEVESKSLSHVKDADFVKLYCQNCKAEFKAIYTKGGAAVASMVFGDDNYEQVPATYAPTTFAVTSYYENIWMEKVSPAIPGVTAGTAGTVAPEAGETVTSPKTFDAGIAMYVGMSVMAAAGSAVVLKKKD